MVPHPFVHTSRQASQNSLDNNNTNIKHRNEINFIHGICRSNSLESLLDQSGDRDEGRSRNSENCVARVLAIDDSQKSATGTSLFCQQCHISPWPSCAGHSVDDTDSKASEPGSDFHCFEALLANQEITMPLRQWIANDIQERAGRGDRYEMRLQKASTLRKVTISYAIAKLLQHLSLHFRINQYSSGKLERICSIDNFVIQLSNEQSDLGWEVMGVDMVNPQVQLKIITSYNFFDLGNDEEFTGRKITASIASPDENSDHVADALKTNDERMLCHFFGMLLHGLFADENVAEIKRHGLPEDHRCYEDMPSAKKRSMQNLPLVGGSEFPQVSSNHNTDKSEVAGQVAALFSTNFGYASLSQVVTNLLDCGLGLLCTRDSYACMEEAIADLCLLLEEPGRFLFEDVPALPEGEHAISIGKGNDRLYGRTAEAHLITDTFCRVVSTGESEAILIGGFSGSGKTRLAQSVFEAVEAIGGFVIVQKFDAVSTLSPSSIVMSAFNELCLMLSKKSTPQELDAIYQGLINEFGANFHVLARALPNVLVMLSPCASLHITKNQTDTFHFANHSSLCFTLQRFMRVVSSTSRPIMLFLDDLQWADPVSLGLVHAVLSDMKGKSCMLFVGTYRDNEVAPDNIIFSFVNMLSQFNVLTSKIHLAGLTEKDVNFMVSDALGALPRLCRSLSHLVYRKTNGSPYFVLEFLRSLVDRDLVQFSLREKRWIWDDAKVCAENITDNVLYLLSNKLNSLSECMRTALKCASCFGIKIHKTIAQQLSGYPKHHSLQSALDDVVKGGFMDYDGAYYRFVHDKVREAAYDLIKPDRRDHYHFELGMAMHSCSVYRVNRDALFATIEQINHGVPSLVRGTAHQNVVAELNYEASCEMMRCSNFTSAFDYITAAVSLLPNDSWTAQYAISLKYHLQLGKAALPCGYIDEAKAALNNVINRGKCLEDKIDAYFLLVAMQSSGAPSPEEIGICVHVLRLLGEDLPRDSLEAPEIFSAVNETKEMFERESDEDLLRMAIIVNDENERIENIMKFYGQLGLISWIAAPKMHAFYMSRFAQFCLKSRVNCKYLPSAFVAFGACLCNGLTNATVVGYRIGKIGMLLLNRSGWDMDEASKVYLSYYHELGVLFEPIQACVDIHRRGYEIEMHAGRTSLAGLHLCLAVHRQIISGANLQSIKTEIEFYLKLAKQHSLAYFEGVMQMYYKNVSALIGEKTIRVEQQIQGGSQYDETQCIQEMMALLFSGHIDRVNYLARKWEVSSEDTLLKVPIRVISVAFFHGLATTKLYRLKGFKCKQPLQNSICKKLLPVLTKAESFSNWNFKHKASILKAEYLSLMSQKDEAEFEYECAISSARVSKFVHEEGLACELAAIHYKYHGDSAKALDLFRQAQKCYEMWGSQMKVDQMMVNQMDLM